MKRSPVTQFAQLVQCFFAEHLTQQKNVSPQTVLAYRDAFRLLFAYLQHRYHKAPSRSLQVIRLNFAGSPATPRI